MQTTLTELQRRPGKIVRAVLLNGKNLTVTQHGQPCAEIVPVPHIDRQAALKALRQIGPFELPARK